MIVCLEYEIMKKKFLIVITFIIKYCCKVEAAPIFEVPNHSLSIYLIRCAVRHIIARENVINKQSSVILCMIISTNIKRKKNVFCISCI
jgi:hypothetical protein